MIVRKFSVTPREKAKKKKKKTNEKYIYIYTFTNSQEPGDRGSECVSRPRNSKNQKQRKCTEPMRLNDKNASFHTELSNKRRKCSFLAEIVNGNAPFYCFRLFFAFGPKFENFSWCRA